MALNNSALISKYEQTLSCCLISTSNTIDFLYAGSGASRFEGTNVCSTLANLITCSACVADGTVVFNSDYQIPVKFDTANAQWTTLDENPAIKNVTTMYQWGYDPGYYIYACPFCSSFTSTCPVSLPNRPTNWRNVTYNSDSSYPGILGITCDGAMWGYGNIRTPPFGINLAANFEGAELYKKGSGWICAILTSTWVAGAGLKNDGTLWTWGCNNSGQLGDGTTIARCCPQQPCGGGNNWCALSGQKGFGHFLALKTDGTLWGWGTNSNGQLGDGTTINKCSPVTVAGGGNTWCYIATGDYHGGAVKTDGTLWTWGNGQQGVLGTGNTASRSSPGTVLGVNEEWCKVQFSACSSYTAFGLKLDGTLWSWGANDQCRLGQNASTCVMSPASVAGGGSTWCDVDSSYYSVHAVKTDGTMWTWGHDYYGGLGLGRVCDVNICFVNSPICVPGRNDWFCVSSGYYNTSGFTKREIV